MLGTEDTKPTLMFSSCCRRPHQVNKNMNSGGGTAGPGRGVREIQERKR